MRGTPVLVNKLPIGDFIADLDFSDVYILTLTRDLTIDIKNAINGVKYTFIIKQDNTGGRVLSFTDKILGNVSITTTANSCTVLEFAGIDNKIQLQSGIGDLIHIPYNTVIPFNHLISDMATTILTGNDIFSINSTDAVNNACTSVLLVNNVSYTPDLTAFHVVGIYDNTLAYTLLSFTLKRGLYIVSILNFD